MFAVSSNLRLASPAQSFLFLGPVGTYDHMFDRSRTNYVGPSLRREEGLVSLLRALSRHSRNLPLASASVSWMLHLFKISI
jgi:hypothetical protein